MRRGHTGRTFALIVLLLLVCYFADWTDDNYSYYVATRWRAFQTANGTPEPVSGGGFDVTRMFRATNAWNIAAKKKDGSSGSTSVVEAVFGRPLGGGSDAATDGDSSDTGMRSLSAANTNSFARSRIGASGQLGGYSGLLGSSTFGRSSATGTSGFSGTSLGSGLSGMSMGSGFAGTAYQP